VEGFVVRESSFAFSSWRANQSLPEYLTHHRIMVVEGIDTRALTRHLRLRGAMKGILSTEDDDRARLIEKAKASPGLVGRDLVKGDLQEPISRRNQTLSCWLPLSVSSPNSVVMDFG
jgi:carbamoyl-phosphate synthase small subunit